MTINNFEVRGGYVYNYKTKKSLHFSDFENALVYIISKLMKQYGK